MCAKGIQHVTDAVAATLVHGDVGVPLIEGAPLVVEVAEGVARRHDHPAVGEVAQPLLHRFKGQAEVDHRSHRLEMRHGGLAVHRAPARGDDRGDGIVSESQIYGLLQSEKASLPLLGYNAVEFSARSLLDHKVGVDEAVPQSLGGQYPHGALPAGGHADEDDMAGGDGVVHGGLRGWLFDCIILHFSFVVKRKDGTKFVRGGGVFWGNWLKTDMDCLAKEAVHIFYQFLSL